MAKDNIGNDLKVSDKIAIKPSDVGEEDIKYAEEIIKIIITILIIYLENIENKIYEIYKGR